MAGRFAQGAAPAGRNRHQDGAARLAHRYAGGSQLDTGLWEVRTDLGDIIARVIFTVVGSEMVLLHCFIKKSQKTPAVDLQTAKQRKSIL